MPESCCNDSFWLLRRELANSAEKLTHQTDRAAQHDEEYELLAQGPIGQVRENIHDRHFPKMLAARFSIWLDKSQSRYSGRCEIDLELYLNYEVSHR